MIEPTYDALDMELAMSGETILRPEGELANIRIDVALECAEVAEGYRLKQLAKAKEFATLMDERSDACELRAQGALMVRDAILDKCEAVAAWQAKQKGGE